MNIVVYDGDVVIRIEEDDGTISKKVVPKPEPEPEKED